MKETIEGNIAFEAHKFILDEMQQKDIKLNIGEYFHIAKSVLFAPIEDKVLEMKHVDPVGTRALFEGFKKAVLENLQEIEVMVGLQE